MMYGLTIIMVDDIVNYNFHLLSNYIDSNNVDLISTTPSRMSLFLENEEFKSVLKKIKTLILGGEQLSLKLCKTISEYSNCKIYNSYGPTECTVGTSFIEIDNNRIEDGNITIGKPVCYGKHNRIMYRTGDLGRWTSEGEIEYLGRIDFQVKINGQRVELGEIESKVYEIPDIQQCVVIDKKKESGEKYLVCYYISSNGEDKLSNKDIRKYLSEKLPRYMVPNYYIRINEIPLSNTGKLNRKALPEPNKKDFISEAYVSPETDIERVICKIYSDLFNIELNEIGRIHDFYELGGDSMNAIRILSRIEKELKIKIYINDIMSRPVICDLGKYIESLINDYENDNNRIEIISKRHCKEFPVTSQQLGVYIDSIKEVNSIIYNAPNIYRLNENIDKEKIKKVFLKIFDEQEILRSKYYGKEINGKIEIYGYIDDECSLKFEEYSYENVESFIRPFELDKAPLMRVGFINDEILLIDMHHIICDGATDLIIMNELNKYYNDEEVEELEIQYSDYAIYLNEKKNNGKLDEQIEIYKEIFSNEYEILNIPKRNIIANNDNNLNDEIGENNRYEQFIS
eukprot:jgi/Orpsp1_1/1185966/evm.model.c7180000096256.1